MIPFKFRRIHRLIKSFGHQLLSPAGHKQKKRRRKFKVLNRRIPHRRRQTAARPEIIIQKRRRALACPELLFKIE